MAPIDSSPGIKEKSPVAAIIRALDTMYKLVIVAWQRLRKLENISEAQSQSEMTLGEDFSRYLLEAHTTCVSVAFQLDS